MTLNYKKILFDISNNPVKFYSYNLIFTYGTGFFIAISFLDLTYKTYSVFVMLTIVTSFMFFYLGWRFAKKIRIKSLTYIESKRMCYFFTVIFIFSSFYIFKDNPSALLKSFFDTDLSTSELRALATKGKSGIDSIINGIYFSASYLGLGMLSVLVFHERKRYKWFVLLFITFLLLLNGQKSRFIISFLPVFILLIHQRKFHQLKLSFLVVSVILGVVMMIYNYDDFSVKNENNSNISMQQRLTTGSRDLFKNETTIKFIIHRQFWIPFITAIDWERYLENGIRDDLLLGASIPILSKVSGMDRVNLDNKVFKYQFDVSQYSRGAANSFFGFDARANFGFIGLIIFAFFSGVIISIIWKSTPYPFNIIVFVWLYSYQSSSMSALFLGGGIFILFFFIIFKNLTK